MGRRSRTLKPGLKLRRKYHPVPAIELCSPFNTTSKIANNTADIFASSIRRVYVTPHNQRGIAKTISLINTQQNPRPCDWPP